MSFKLLTIVLIVSSVQFSYSKEYPKNIPRCHPTDDECLVRVANEVIQKYPHGYPGLNLDTVEPFKIGTIIIKGDSSKSVNINLEMTDLIINGYSKFTFSKFTGFKNDPKDLVVELEGSNKDIELKGKYKVTGKMLVFPLTGEGDISCRIEGLHIKSRSKPTVVTIDGKQYLRVNSTKLKAKADHMTISMTNLFNGDKALGDSMNKILNENWEVIWAEMEPAFNEKLAEVHAVAVSKVLHDFAYNDLFIIDK